MALDLTQPRAAAPAVPSQQKAGLAAIIKAKVANTLAGKKGEQFTADVVALVNANPDLGTCDPISLIGACLQAQTLNLSLNRSMGQAWIVPFNEKAKVDKRTGEIIRPARVVATFQMGYKGYVQLAIRSGQYRKLNVLAIKEGELLHWDPLFEDISVELIADESVRAKTPTAGYYAMFEYVNGFRKAMYWSRAKMHEHATQYSQAYRTDQQKGWSNSFWTKDFDAMAVKTMLRQLISKWGIMSVDMQAALENDGKLADGSYTEGNVLDADFMTAPAPAQIVDVETGEVTEEQAEEAPAEAEQKPKKRKYLCPELNGKPMTESECSKCQRRSGCPEHDE